MFVSETVTPCLLARSSRLSEDPDRDRLHHYGCVAATAHVAGHSVADPCSSGVHFIRRNHVEVGATA